MSRVETAVEDRNEFSLRRWLKRFASFVAILLAYVVAEVTLVPTPATTVTARAGRPSEFAFALSRRTLPAGNVTFIVRNDGLLVHAFKVCSTPRVDDAADSCAGFSTPLVPPGGSAVLSVAFPTAGRYEYLCPIPGNAAAGMKGELTIS